MVVSVVASDGGFEWWFRSVVSSGSLGGCVCVCACELRVVTRIHVRVGAHVRVRFLLG
jgi:hypothetical protein